ncbi:MAG: hypothetical protein NTZ07_02860 [Candidatus Woesebacteria bacterium]|nr:hypothetical protein [Candidatus Woesebacteria bacterium]
MKEKPSKTLPITAGRLATAYKDYLESPELRQKLIDNEKAALNTDEIIEGHAERLGIDPEELKRVLKRPQ